MDTSNQNSSENKALHFITDSLENKRSVDKIINQLRIFILAESPLENQIKYINTIAQFTLLKADEHFQTCSNPKRCEEAMIWRDLLFFINEMQVEFAIGLNNEEVFSLEEIEQLSEEIKVFIQPFREKERSRDTFSIADEILELSNLFFLGKKNWKYLVIGKASSLKESDLINNEQAKSLLEIVTKI